MAKPKVIVICGPTASGKTALSIELAKKINGQIVSSDSMQIYKDMNIGTAKPTKEEMEHREALKKVGSDEPTFESAIQVLDSDGNVLNVIVRKYYNSRRIPREEDKEPELVYNIFDDIVSS